MKEFISMQSSLFTCIFNKLACYPLRAVHGLVSCHQVFFLDYGNQSEVEVTELYMLDEAFLSNPFQVASDDCDTTYFDNFFVYHNLNKLKLPFSVMSIFIKFLQIVQLKEISN